MKNRSILYLLLFIISPLLSINTFAEDTDLLNDESEQWYVKAYYSDGFSVVSEGPYLSISAEKENDLRLCRTVSLEKNTVYVFSADVTCNGVYGGKGATLSVDNYSIDGSYIYSRSLYANESERVTLIFKTGESQTSVLLALRIGGYSELSVGNAEFSNLTLYKGTPETGNVQYLGKSNGLQTSANNNSVTEARKIFLKSVPHLFCVLFVLVAVFLLYGVFLNRSKLAAAPLLSNRNCLTAAVVIGLLLRFILCSAWGGHASDMSCWIGWGSYISEHGMADFYTAPGHEWYDYPPAYMMVLGLICRVLTALHIPYRSSLGLFSFMLPAYAADIGTAVILCRFAKKKELPVPWGTFLALIVIFQPSAVVLSGAWGQIDSILTFFLLLSFLTLFKNRRVLSGVIYAIAIMIKWQALIYGPVLAAAFLFSIRSRKELLTTAAAVFCALTTIFAFSLPFRGNQDYLWVIKRFIQAGSGYNYASVEAYNFMALCGGNWANADKSLLGPITFKAFGTVMILFSVLVSVFKVYSSRADLTFDSGENALAEESVFLSASFCMYAIFTFGHYMHERYVFPVILLLLFAFTAGKNKHFLFSALLLSSVLFLNEIMAMFIVSKDAISIVRSGTEHQSTVYLCAAAEVLSFFHFSVSLCLHQTRGR